MANQSVRTVDHIEIKEWVEERGGQPSLVADSRDGIGGILRFDWSGKGQDEDTGELLEHVSWEEFFRIFDENDFAFLYGDGTSEAGPFYAFVPRHENGEMDDALVEDTMEDPRDDVI